MGAGRSSPRLLDVVVLLDLVLCEQEVEIHQLDVDQVWRVGEPVRSSQR